MLKIFLICFITSLFSACSKTKLKTDGDLIRVTETRSYLFNGIALIGNSSTSQSDLEDQENCIESELKNSSPSLQIVKTKQFRDALYPYFWDFHPDTTPQFQQEMKNLLENAGVRERLASLKVRYLVFFLQNSTRRFTNNTAEDGFILPSNVGFFGYVTMDRNSVFGVQVWDIVTRDVLGTIYTKAEGRGLGLILLVLPLPLYVPATESSVCKEIGSQLKKALDISG